MTGARTTRPRKPAATAPKRPDKARRALGEAIAKRAEDVVRGCEVRLGAAKILDTAVAEFNAEFGERRRASQRLGAQLIARWLLTGEVSKPEERAWLGGLGELAARASVSIAAMTHGYLIFRDVLQQVAEEEAAKLGTPAEVLEAVAGANRASCDSSIIWMTRAFDRQTEQQAAESIHLQSELAASEVRYRSLFESITSGVLVVSSDGVVSASNDATLAILGATREELVGTRVSEIVKRFTDESGAPLGRLPSAIASSSGTPVRNQVVKHEGAGGRPPVWIQVDAVPIFGPEQELVEVVMSFVDVSAVKAAEALRAESEAKSRFLATMSHELRTPLNSIIGFSQLLRMQAGDSLDERQLRYLGHIESSGKNLLALISDILELTKVAAGQITLEVVPVEVVKMLKEAVAELQPQLAEKGLEVKLSTPARLLARADEKRCRQVITNLLANAVKFTDAGGITVTAGSGGDVVEMVFADTGIGIPEEQLERVFDEFTQVDSGATRAYGGTGLGLPLTKRLVEIMSGRLTLSSVLGQGTTVRVLLPIATE